MALSAALSCSGSGAADTQAPAAPLEAAFGYPKTTSRLILDLGHDLRKICHASLVHPAWALTAAHCFAGVAPDARGALPDFERGFSVRGVQLYPGAHLGTQTQVDAAWSGQQFVASDDLALVPLDPPITDIAVLGSWRPSGACALGSLSGLVGEVGLLSSADEAMTGQATILGEVSARSLLGPGQPGRLLSARGAIVGPGDSGSGMSIDWAQLQPAITNCPIDPSPGLDADQVLVGVIQDANLEDPDLPFGLVALYDPPHAGWLAALLDATPAPNASEERPRLPR